MYDTEPILDVNGSEEHSCPRAPRYRVLNMKELDVAEGRWELKDGGADEPAGLRRLKVWADGHGHDTDQSSPADLMASCKEAGVGWCSQRTTDLTSPFDSMQVRAEHDAV